MFLSRTEESTSKKSSTWSCCCGDAKDGVDLVDDHVSDEVDQQILNKPSVFNGSWVISLLWYRGSNSEGNHQEENKQILQHFVSDKLQLITGSQGKDETSFICFSGHQVV